MWYIIWILGILFVCAFSIIIALVLEHLELIEENKKEKQ